MENKSRLFEWLMPQAEGVNVNYRFAPLNDTSIMKIAWNSPNDNKSNLINFLMDLEPYTIRIKDNH